PPRPGKDPAAADHDVALLFREVVRILDQSAVLGLHDARRYRRWGGGSQGSGPGSLRVRAYQAKASGAGPPGPGQISSSRFIVGLSSLRSSARIALSSCSGIRGPMIGAVTTGFASSQASATSAGGWPSSAQNFSYAST